jgi:hypothetical protein
MNLVARFETVSLPAIRKGTLNRVVLPRRNDIQGGDGGLFE